MTEEQHFCKDCKTWKPRTAFRRDRSIKAGLKSECKACMSTDGERRRNREFNALARWPAPRAS